MTVGSIRRQTSALISFQKNGMSKEMPPHISLFEEAQRQAKHPAWELDKSGVAHVKRGYVLIYVVMLGLACIGYFDPTNMVFLGSGYAEVFHVVYIFAAGCAIFTAWVMLPWLQKNDARVIGRLIAALLLCGCVYGMALFICFATVPKIATLVVTKPGEVTLDVLAVRRESSVRSRRTFGRLFQFDRQWYEYELEGQPDLSVFYSKSAHGFMVLPRRAWLGDPERGRFAGQENWFGLRVKTVEKLELVCQDPDVESSRIGRSRATKYSRDARKPVT